MQQEPKTETMEALVSVAMDHLRNNLSIQMVAIDFDQTLLDIHILEVNCKEVQRSIDGPCTTGDAEIYNSVGGRQDPILHCHLFLSTRPDS